MTDETLKNIEMMRQKLEEVWENMTPNDFARVHAKFFGAILSVEQGFKKHFPKEWERYQKDFYGDD